MVVVGGWVIVESMLSTGTSDFKVAISTLSSASLGSRPSPLRARFNCARAGSARAPGTEANLLQREKFLCL